MRQLTGASNRNRPAVPIRPSPASQAVGHSQAEVQVFVRHSLDTATGGSCVFLEATMERRVGYRAHPTCSVLPPLSVPTLMSATSVVCLRVVHAVPLQDRTPCSSAAPYGCSTARGFRWRCASAGQMGRCLAREGTRATSGWWRRRWVQAMDTSACWPPGMQLNSAVGDAVFVTWASAFHERTFRTPFC